MSRRDPKAHYDGFSVIRRGVNSGVPPVAVGADQLAWGVNISARGGYVGPRPGWVKRTLVFADATDQGRFEDALFAGAVVFERYGQIVASIGGRIFRIDPDVWAVSDVSIAADLNASDKYRAWFAEAENWVVIQDGTDIPLFYNGGACSRSDTTGAGGKVQIPVGKAMVYSQGRLVISYANGRTFVVGDIVGGDSGTAGQQFLDAVLCMTENSVLNGGGAFSVPINSGLVTALRPVAQVDTSTGQGPTQVFTTNAIFSLNTPSDRDTWADVNFPIGTVSNVNAGSVSDRATVNVNGDIWFRAPDGVRSFVVARRDFGTWTNSPLSDEVGRALDYDDPTLLGYASAALSDKRLLMTTRPYRVWNHGIVHQGLVALDFSHLASISERGQAPAWDGLWTGLNFLQVLHGAINGVERTFAFALNASNEIELWELDASRTSDDGVPIEWAIETKAFTFSDSPLPGREMLTLDSGRLYLDEIFGNVTIAVYYRSDQDPCWREWHDWSICATDADCTVGATCGPPAALRRQYRMFTLPSPADGCDTTVSKRTNWGREFQVRIVITGQARIKLLELVAHEQQEDITTVCPADEACVAADCCPVDDFTHSSYA